MLPLVDTPLVDGADKELDSSQPCFFNSLMDLFPSVSEEEDSNKWQEQMKSLLQGVRCSKEEKDVAHLGCIHHLVSICKDFLEGPDLFNDKPACSNLRKKFSSCVKVFKLLRTLTKDYPCTYFDIKLVKSIASFAETLSAVFRASFEFPSSGHVIEGSFESLIILLLEEFIQFVHAIFCNTTVFQNIQVCVAASILENLGPDLWRYNTTVSNPKPPLAYFPRVVVYLLRLILDVRDQTYQLFRGLNMEYISCDTDSQMESPTCKVNSDSVFVLKKYTVEELFRIMFPPRVQWVDNMMHLVSFLHSEGIRLRPKLDGSSSTATKVSGTPELETTVCHEDEALFGDLFSEGSRSVGSSDAYDQSAVASSSVSNFSNMLAEAETKLLSFLKNCAFAPDWCRPFYEDGCQKFKSNHFSILLYIVHSHTCEPDGKKSDAAKLGLDLVIHERCIELLHSLLSFRALPDSLEESLVEKILVQNGALMYNNQTLALIAHTIICRVGMAGSHLRSKLYEVFVDYINDKAKVISSNCPSIKEFVRDLPSLFHIEILLMAFHLSSEDEKAALANLVFANLRAVGDPAGFDGTQMSCWALLLSRLIVVLRHMLYYPRGCPSFLITEFRTKLRESSTSGMHSCGLSSNISSWSSVLLDGVTSASIKEAPFINELLDHLIDVVPSAAVCREYPSVECLGLSWDEISASFSWILSSWKGRKPKKVEDLILERYTFVLCWVIPNMKSTPDYLLPFLHGTVDPDISSTEHFVYFGRAILGHAGGSIDHAAFSRISLCLLHQLHNSHVPEDVGELGWDFLRCGSWLSLLLSILTTGIWAYCRKMSITYVVPKWTEHASIDTDFFALGDSVISIITPEQATQLVNVISSLLERYLQVYQKAFLLTFDNGQRFAVGMSPIFLFTHTGLDKCMKDEIFEKMGFKQCQLEPLQELISKVGVAVDKLSFGIRFKVFWDSVLHGLPCHIQAPSGILLSSILSIIDIVTALNGLLRIVDAGEITSLERQTIQQILELVLRIKGDSVFEGIHGICDAIYQNLTRDSERYDYSTLSIIKCIEEVLMNVNKREVCNSGIHECLVSCAIDIVNKLKKDPSGSGFFKYLLSVEGVSEGIKNLYGSQRCDFLFLVESLENCNSEAVNVKVFNFFVELLSGDMCTDVKHKLHKKFLGMSPFHLSKWLGRRLLGFIEGTDGVACAKGASNSLRESTMNFITCITSTSSETPSDELHSHIFEAMLISLDSAFLMFDPTTAKCYFNLVVQTCRGERSIRALLQRITMLIEKLAGNGHLLQGLKYIVDFLATLLSDSSSNKDSFDKPSMKSACGLSLGVGPPASRILGSRKNADAIYLSASQAGSTSLECDATSVDEDEDDGTSDGEIGSIDKDEDDDNNSERALASKVCTFTSSGSNFMEQHWYFCYTCDLTISKGCCSVCAKVCHRDHRVVYSRSSRFFCDCGAGGVRGSTCQCLKPRKFAGSNNAPNRGSGNFQSFLHFTGSGDQLPDSESDDEGIFVDSENSVRIPFAKELQERMPILLSELDIESHVMRLCSSLLTPIIIRRDSSLSRERNISLGEDKVLCYSGDILQLKKTYKSGSLDLKIKTDYSNTKELKSLLASGSLIKSLLSVNSRGRLAVGEGDKVAIFDVGQLIGQPSVAPVMADKANVKPLSKNVVRFEIVHLVFNPLAENYLAVAGYEDCQVFTVNHRGEVNDRLAIELSLQGAYIKRVYWVPGSQVQLMVVTNKYVKIYDLSQDNISPMQYLTLPDDMIVDATPVMASQGKVFIIVLSESGCLYRVDLSVRGNVGATPLKEVMQMEGRDAHQKGCSLYFSSIHGFLFVSFQDGTTLVGRVNPDATSLTEISALLDNEPDSNLRPAGLYHWKELFGDGALFVCFSSLKSNAALAVSIGEHQVAAQNMRHSVALTSTSPVVGIAAYSKHLSKDKIHCLVLYDDGSLQIYLHVPAGIDTDISAITDKVKRLGPGILNNKAYGGAKPEFPLDFFEKTICITHDVKLSSEAIKNGDSEGVKQILATEDGFLESPSPGGFKITVSNSNPDIVMVGLRLHVGNTSADHIPSEVTVFQRTIKLDEGMRSWYDIPFTEAESLLADEEFTICVGPTFGGSALPRIDSLEVYCQAKDEFGWKEKMNDVLNMEAHVLGSNSWVVGSGSKSHATQSVQFQEQIMADSLNILSSIYALCKPQGCSKVEDVKCKQLLESVFESDREPLLQSAACRVLRAIFPRREIFHQVKDAMRLTGVVKSAAMLSSKLGIGGTTARWIIEEFTSQMCAVSKIALQRRSNLASFIEMNGSEVVDGLMQVLWGILYIEQPDTQTMNNIVVSSVELIYCYAECLALHGKDVGRMSVAPAVSLFKKLLLSTNKAVQTSSSLAISSRLLQVPFPKQTMLGTDDAENSSSAPIRAAASTGGSGNTQVMVEEDSITSSVQYCCDGCSTVPILRRRWHCTVCPDFDLCEACYEVLGADRLPPPPHSRDHPMTAIPIEVETYGDGNEIHFTTDDLSDSGLLAVASDVGTQNSGPSIHELEPNDSGEFSASLLDPVTISASKRAVNSLLLSEFLEQLKGWMETTSGVQALPVMQLFHRLASAVGGPFSGNSEPESLDLEKLIKWFLEEINISKPPAAKTRTPFGEVTILVFMFFTLMLRNWHQPGSDGGSATKSGSTTEVPDKSVSTSMAASSIVDGQEKNDFIIDLHRACETLRHQTFVNYLMDILQQLVNVFKSPSITTDASYGMNAASGCGALLVIRREVPAGNFSPFFSDSYAKSHRSDIFADYHRLLLENTFRLLYSLIRPEKHEKGVEKEKSCKVSLSKDLKLDGYQDVFCSYINNPHTTFVRRYARRLFLHLCGSKTHYYSVRDSWQFSNDLKKLYKHINKSGGFESTMSYERSVKIVKSLSTMAEVASSRPRNWQKYCLRHADVLPYLVSGVFYFGEECLIQTLKLLNLAFYTGNIYNHSSQKVEGGDIGTVASKSGVPLLESKKKKKGEESESSAEKTHFDMEAVVDVLVGKGGDTLKQFIDCFLLEWNSSSVRMEAKFVLFGIWHHGNQSFKEALLTVLLQKIKCLPMYGQNITEYTELLTFLLGKVPENSSKQQCAEILDKCLTNDVIRSIFDTLHSQNELLANHPNSRIYNTLSGLVEFDGYYLESEPCVACSSPEVPYSRMKLESIKSETKFTGNRIIVKCTGSFTIQSVIMNVHDARKSKSVKVLNIYYNNRPVADLSELKNNWSLWKRVKSCHLTFNQTELKVDFPIPITACNFMIELDSFYENLQALSLEPLQCPRCSRPVTDKHGICGNCHENAYQCRQCRNINYENLDSFLCNECGYSKYGRFEFNFMAKPSFTFDSMENDEDMKRGLASIEFESENAHKRYQQLLGFKKPLLKIVSSIGENEMDSQQKDSVQQMMVSLPGPSCKINRKIALLGVLYGEKCKASFDIVSKSVQTLQGLRRVLMNYLHKKQSGNSTATSRLAVSRSQNSCYGCASTFVTQCVEILLVLAKHPTSKKQLVAAGILSELFENNIHQGPKAARIQARAVLCAFSEGDVNAVAELNTLMQKKVLYCLEHHRSIDIALATREDLSLLSDVCSLADEFWESRLRVVFPLLFSSIKSGAKHPVISEHIILPCLRIISQACTPPKPDVPEKECVVGKSAQDTQTKEEGNTNVSASSTLVCGSKLGSESKSWSDSQQVQDMQLLSYSEWEKGASYLDFVRRQYKVSQAAKGGQRSLLQRHDYLALKYGLRWKRRVCKSDRSNMPSFELGSWVSELILSACSQSIRSEMCMLISLLCGQSSMRQHRLLNLLMSLLPATLSAGENAAEYFELLFKMIDSEDTCLFLTASGCLKTICKLITQELSNVESLERSLHVDISQGFILHKLIELLGKFLKIPNIRSRFMREHLLSEVLEALIVIRGLVVQKTKLINDCNKLLKDLLDSLLLERDENKHQFIQACISGLQIHGDESKGRTSLFILEQLCNLISPSKPEPIYFLILNKAHTQEEFIRGSMTKNPYSSAEVGPLMRDVKNKICQQLDLLGLLEDDYGMELLVAGNIISLDLSIAQVYEQVWKKSSSHSSSTTVGTTLISSTSAASARDCPPMTVTYRLQGLDGEATEPMIKELDEDREETQDPEVEFAIASAVRECGGLEILLGMVQRLQDDFKSNQEQLVAVLNLLMLCCKIRENRKTLLRLGALGSLLETARRAFLVDAMEPAEGILLIVESLTLEANNSHNISFTPGVLTVSNEERGGGGEQAKKIVLLFLERLSHPSGLKKSSKQERNTEMVARILPYLTYGEPAAMEVLIHHFEPFLQDWVEFDRLQRLHEEDPKDEGIYQKASKQKFTLENFVRVSESLKSSSCGERLKDIILEKGIIRSAVEHLKNSFAFTGHEGYRSTAEWTAGLKLPSVPLIMSMLRGLSMGHLATQTCIDDGGILPLLHALEGVSGENEIGARAENLLNTLSDKEGKGDGFLSEKVCQLRDATRDRIRRIALKKREQLLKGLGWASDGGDRIVVAQPVLEGLEDVEEEDGLACMVCREGYQLRPTDLLGAYTYSKRVNLGVGTSANARGGDCVYTTVSHFNVIHFQCHHEAKRADAALKNPKREWDGAALRNNETLCNNLFPLRAASVPIGQYVRYVDQYWEYLNALGRVDGNRLRLLTYDIVLMLARFATRASFSADSRGGGKESNARFLPFMIQMARHLLEYDSTQQRYTMAKSISTYLAPSSEPKNTSAAAAAAAGTEETVQFMMVSSLLVESYESWLDHRFGFLQRGISHAYMQHTHGRRPNPLGPAGGNSTTVTTTSDESGGDLLSIIQPMLVYTGLIEQLQRFFKVATVTKKAVTESSSGSKEEGVEGLEGWEVIMKERTLNVKEMVGFSKELLSWLDDMLSASDLQEAFDVLGVLSDVLSGGRGGGRGFASCEDFVRAAIDAKTP
ncbi:hypothetical protein DM860_005064 [Cuscuta australis]|uniref:Auxin transport protein BIG n=1 Tax=Cuscuta australis TaxID=267555 RepID=A0A328DM97_9ASTE|nr:hypothetical protein DM860_005064 [Cuscuta australis]